MKIKIELDFGLSKALISFKRRDMSLLFYLNEIHLDLEKKNKMDLIVKYKSCVLKFVEFMDNKVVRISDIDKGNLCKYEEYLFALGLKPNTVSFYMRCLRSLYNRAVEDGFVNQTFPFTGVYTGIDKTKKRMVTYDILKKLKEAKFDTSLSFARDVFLLSYSLRGLPFIDLAYLTKSDYDGEYIFIKRHKTGELLCIYVEDYAREIISNYANTNSQYLLPILYYNNKVHNYSTALRIQNSRLSRISKILNLKSNLSTYVARHSWASIAKERGIPISIISESLGHTSEKTTKIYLSSFNQSILDEANKKLLL